MTEHKPTSSLLRAISPNFALLRALLMSRFVMLFQSLCILYTSISAPHLMFVSVFPANFVTLVIMFFPFDFHVSVSVHTGLFVSSLLISLFLCLFRHISACVVICLSDRVFLFDSVFAVHGMALC